MLIPSIDLKGGQTVQLIGGKELAIEAGDPMLLAKKFAMVGEIATIDLDGALGSGTNAKLLIDLVRNYRCRVGGGIRKIDAAIRWLDNGASKIIIGTAATPEFLSQLPRERLIVALDAVNGEVVTQGWTNKTGLDVLQQIELLKPYTANFLVTFVEREGRLQGIDMERARAIIEAAKDAKVTIAGGVTTAEEIKELDELGADAQVGMALYTGKLSLAEAFSAPLISDREDGLWPTVVVDDFGFALGLCWSNIESLSLAIEEQRGIYFSRRSGIWRKGETSGATQQLIRIDADCDRDALRFVVKQSGAGFCHNNTRSCWGEDWGLGGLFRLLQQRKNSAPEGSYTKRLFEEEGLLEKKVIEEAMELTQASEPAELASEAADLLYFTLTTLAKRGQELSAVQQILEKRALKVTRRKGDAKW